MCTMCACVFIHVCITTCVCTSIYMHIFHITSQQKIFAAGGRVRVCASVCMCVCVLVCVYMHTCICMHTYTWSVSHLKKSQLPRFQQLSFRLWHNVRTCTPVPNAVTNWHCSAFGYRRGVLHYNSCGRSKMVESAWIAGFRGNLIPLHCSGGFQQINQIQMQKFRQWMWKCQEKPDFYESKEKDSST